MRAVLIVNPNATTTNPLRRDVLIRALRTEVELSVVQTHARGHAIDVAADSARDGVDLVISLGGDGTINEIVNGLMHAKAEGEEAGAGSPMPALGVVPGGSTNVFARALGLPRDPVDATGALLEGLRTGQRRTVGLGKMDDRWFTFAAGIGFDAAVISGVEDQRERGKRSTPSRYARSAFNQYVKGFRNRGPAFTLELPDGERQDLAMLVVQNTAPWTYMGSRAVHACPDAAFSAGLDLMGLTALGPGTLARTAAALLTGRAPSGKHVFRRHDVESFAISTDTPVPVHVDGDFLGSRTRVEFATMRDALQVVAPGTELAPFQ